MTSSLMTLYCTEYRVRYHWQSIVWYRVLWYRYRPPLTSTGNDLYQNNYTLSKRWDRFAPLHFSSIYTFHSIGANAPSLVLGQCTIVVWTAPTRTYGRIIGYDVNFVLLGSDEDVTITKGSRELFHVIGDEIPPGNEMSILVQVLYVYYAVVDGTIQ